MEGGAGAIILLLIALAVWLPPRDSPEDGDGVHATRGDIVCPPIITEEVDRIVCALPQGMAAFNAPARMVRGRTHAISLILSRTEGDALRDMVKDITGDTTSPVELVPVKMSPRMTARLQGQNFVITPSASDAETVAVGHTGRVEFDWQVTPVKEGAHVLVLTIDAMVGLKAGDVPLRTTVLRRSILVRVSPVDRAKQVLAWILDHWIVLSAIPVSFYGLYRFTTRRQNDVDPPSPT